LKILLREAEEAHQVPTEHVLWKRPLLVGIRSSFEQKAQHPRMSHRLPSGHLEPLPFSCFCVWSSSVQASRLAGGTLVNKPRIWSEPGRSLTRLAGRLSHLKILRKFSSGLNLSRLISLP